MHILILLISLIFSPVPQQGRKSLVITNQQIQVKGYTSLGGFNCGFQRLGKADTLHLNSPGTDPAMQFQIPVKNFSCGNFLLTKDFRSTLKADEYPFATVQVKNFREKAGKIFCHLTVSLVGKKLDFPDLMLERVNSGLMGKLILNFEMLNLNPPNKFGGMVKVQDQLDLELILGM